jgi:hypothetical protein
MAEIRMDFREGLGKGREYPATADMYVARRGGKFCKMSAQGLATLCATGDSVVAGWMVTPKDAAGKNAWKSSSTAGADKVFVIYGLDDVYELPVDGANASIAASYVGMGAAIVNSGATYALVQKAKIGGSITSSPLTIVDVDTTNKTAFVKIKTTSKQQV